MIPDGELRAERDDPPPARPDRTSAILLAIATSILVAVAALWLWPKPVERQPPPPPTERTEVTPRQEAAPQPQAAASAPAQHPVAADEQPFEPQDVQAALGTLLGTKAAATFLQAEDFPRRFAATVDSLAREHSPSAIWPVLPTPGRFLVEERAEGTFIAPENAARYTPFVLLAGTVDVAAAVRLYRRLYPLLQQAWRQLGFGDRYFNDRLVEVIDVLLATPEAPESPRVQLQPIRGPIPSLQPWVRYQFVDPELEALTAGQKILVRVGPVNQRRLKARLAEFRKELTLPAAGTK